MYPLALVFLRVRIARQVLSFSFLSCQGYTSSKDCLVLLVDATERMFHTSGENEDTPFELSLKVSAVRVCTFTRTCRRHVR